MISRFILYATTLLFLGQLFAQGPQIRLETDSLSFDMLRFQSQDQQVKIYNDGDQQLNITFSDMATGTMAAAPLQASGGEALREVLLANMAQLRRQIALQNPASPPPVHSTQPLNASVVITDPAGDSNNPGVDVVSVDISSNALFYNFQVVFAGPPDTAAVVLLSIDLDQNLATGEYPAPLGIGLGNFDIGAEYNVLFDIGNLAGDSLGIPPSAIVFAPGFTLVGFPFPLSTNGNTVSVSLPRLLFPIVDNNMNVAMGSLSTAGIDLPDFAPDYGHGLLGQEDGLSWLAQTDAVGAGATPLTMSIAPGDSAAFGARAASVNPEGIYTANINLSNNSTNNPSADIALSLEIGGLANPVASLSPASWQDSLLVNQGAVQQEFLLSNTGSGSLIYTVVDSGGAGWLRVDLLIPLGRLEPGPAATIPVTIDPTGLIPGQLYSAQVQIISNDTANTVLRVPIELYVQSATGIGPEASVSEQFQLYANYPNPFNPETTIRVNIARSQDLQLAIFDLAGRQVRSLHRGLLATGEHRFRWNGRADNGQPVASGLYFYRLSGEGQAASRKMLLVR